VRSRIVELAANMRPTGALQAMRLAQIPMTGHGGVENLSRIQGGDLTLQIADAPGIPGRVVVGVVERFPSGFIDVLWAGWANTEEEALAIGLPQYRQIRAARKG
jgi:hypothetical protein